MVIIVLYCIVLCVNIGMEFNREGIHLRTACTEQHVQYHQGGTLLTFYKSRIKLGVSTISHLLRSTRLLVVLEASEFSAGPEFPSLSLIQLVIILFLLGIGTSLITR